MTHPFLKKNDKCIVCESLKITLYLDLGKTALANDYRTKKDLLVPENKAPLKVAYCNECTLSQLTHTVNREFIFKNYLYFSSASTQLQEFFKDYAEEIIEKFPDKAKKLTIEIASNDGILLKPLKKMGARVLGVEPAKNISKVANKEGIKTLPYFFNLKTSFKIQKEYGKAGLIIANNVLAHTDNPNDMISGVKNLLAENGVFMFQVKYLSDFIEKNEFDTIYHEHISYFSLRSLDFLLSKHGLKIFDVSHVSQEGGSIRVSVCHNNFKIKKNVSIKKFLEKEKKDGLYKINTYKKFSKKPLKVKENLTSILKKLKKNNFEIAGYGASAKGNTLLQYCNINKKLLNYIVDSSPYKQGKYTPQTHIPIVSPEKFKKDMPDYILLLAWNFKDSILSKEKWFLNQGGKFIIPIPEPVIYP